MTEKIELLRTAVIQGASDIILQPGAPPMMRLKGVMVPVSPTAVPLTADQCRELVMGGLNDDQRKRFDADKDLDYAFETPVAGRFRANIFQQYHGLSAVYRVISHRIPEPEGLGLTKEMRDLTDLPNGLVIVTGPPGSGKSTTMASLIEQINIKYQKNIITIEDPVEFVYERKKSVIHQREVGTDTKSFHEALRHALRESPDVILIGELRDYETIQLAVTAAETGHLCFSTLHTRDCASIFNRIIDTFPAIQQSQIRTQVSLTLRAVIAQILVPTADGKGRMAAREFMTINSAISSGIRDNNANAIYSAIQTGRKFGMHTMDQDLARLVAEKKVKLEDAMTLTSHPEVFKQILAESVKK